MIITLATSVDGEFILREIVAKCVISTLSSAYSRSVCNKGDWVRWPMRQPSNRDQMLKLLATIGCCI